MQKVILLPTQFLQIQLMELLFQAKAYLLILTMDLNQRLMFSNILQMMELETVSQFQLQ